MNIQISMNQCQIFLKNHIFSKYSNLFLDTLAYIFQMGRNNFTWFLTFLLALKPTVDKNAVNTRLQYWYNKYVASLEDLDVWYNNLMMFASRPLFTYFMQVNSSEYIIPEYGGDKVVQLVTYWRVSTWYFDIFILKVLSI